MTEINEEEAKKRLIESGLSDSHINSIFKALKGHRVNFRKTKIEAVNIKKDFKEMMNTGHTKKQALKILQNLYNKSELNIGKILKGN